jgi:hypothetical protein
MVWIKEAEHVEDYRIHVIFNDDESGIIDLREVIYSDTRPVFRELRDMKKFRQFDVEFDTIVWKNGLDLPPEFLYSLLMQSQHAS